MSKATRPSLIANINEQKAAWTVALLASISVVGITIANMLSDTPDTTASNQNNPAITSHQSSGVEIIEKPKQLAKATHSTPITTPTAKPKQTIKTTQPGIVHPKPKATSPANAPKPASHQVSTARGKFFVQVGAFKEHARAKALYRKMKHTYKQVQMVPKSGFYAVWVGPVASKKDAAALKASIAKQHKIKGFITRLK